MKITLYTSGSTGQAKKVTHDEKDFYSAGHWLVEKWRLAVSYTHLTLPTKA